MLFAVQELLYNSRYRLILYGLLLLSLVSIIFFLMRVFVFHSFGANEYIILFFTGLSLAFACYVWRSKNLKWGSILFHALLLVLIPTRVLLSGGIASPVVSAYFGHCVLAFVLNGKKGGVAILGWSMFSVIVMSVYETRHGTPNTLLSTDPFYYAFVFTLMFILVTVPILFVLRDKNILLQRVQQLEEKESLYIVMRRINHEYGNSLNVLFGYLTLLKEDKAFELIPFMEARLMEIQGLVKLLSKTAQEGTLVDILEKHETEINILDKLEASKTE